DEERSPSSVFRLPSQRAVSCALAMQAAMRAFPDLALKVAIASGPVQRFVVGDPTIRLLDVLAGTTIARTATAERLAQSGEVLCDEATAHACGDALHINEWRTDAEMGARFAVIITEDGRSPTVGIPSAVFRLPSAEMPAELLRPWILPAVYARQQA